MTLWINISAIEAEGVEKGTEAVEPFEIISFGCYEQDNNPENGKEPIEWYVLAKEDGKALVISKYALDSQPYNTSMSDVIWETCSLRKWLNSTFINTAFSSDEQKNILDTDIVAEKNYHYSDNLGKHTTDKVFSLSIDEAKKFFPNDESRKCVPTAYAKAQGTVYSLDYTTASGEATCFWWLRSNPDYGYSAARVNYDGSIPLSGQNVDCDNYCVRPAMWIDISDITINNSTEHEENTVSPKINEKLKTANIGDTVLFGVYEQDNNLENGPEPIEWQVLAKEDGKALVISKYALDCQPYNTEYEDVTWESCSLRNWLNSTFLNDAFSVDEKAMIQDTKVSADKNPEYDTDPGSATTDTVFLLSTNEAKQYFSSDEARKCAPTEYAVANRAYINSGNCWWWLRSPGHNQYRAAYVSYDGSVYYTGPGVHYDRDCVRPALWINLES